MKKSNKSNKSAEAKESLDYSEFVDSDKSCAGAEELVGEGPDVSMLEMSKSVRTSSGRTQTKSKSVFLPTAFKVCTALITLLLALVLFSPFKQISTEKLTMSADQERERTFIMVKPDGVQRGLVGEIVKRFENKGFKLVAMKFMWADEALLKNHYADLSSKSFFTGLVNYMGSGPVCPMVWEGLNVVKTGRQMLGETDPAKSLPGTIRGDYCIEIGRNIIHGSDAVDSAKKEINLWFKPEELVKWAPNENPWLYE